MMEGIRQMEEMARAWQDAQRKVWENALSAMSGSTQGRPPNEAWGQLIDAWETSVNQALDAQAAWLRVWLESGQRASAVGNQGQAAEAWARRGQEALQQWTDNQRQLWKTWFAIARQVASTSWQASGASAAPDLLRAWQEPLRQAMDAQAEWARRWAGAARQQREGG